MSIAEVPAERRIGAPALARLLGSPPPSGPAYLALADAPVRALLPVLRELVQMTKYVGAQIDSVLTNGLLLVSQNNGLDRAFVIFGALLLVLLLTLAALLSAGPLMRLIGNKGEAVITRLLGVLLAALAAQFVIDGLKASFPSLG